MSLSASRIEELRGNMMLVMDPTFISILTNSFYGGQLGPDKSKKTEFTSTEDRLIEIISEGLNRMLEAAWKDLMPINLTVQGREVNPQFVSFVDGSELVIICSFVVQLPGMDAANFDLIYPLQTLKPIASLLRSKVQSDVVEDDVSWRNRLEKAVLEIPLKISARLSKPVVSMSKLISVKPGEVIPIQIGEGIEVRVEDKPIFLGEMGEVSGQSAINLNKRLTS
jgi:flagellar motor switch protein FliM